MPQPTIDLPPNATPDQVQLFQAIQSGLDENDYEIQIVANALNKGIAQLVHKNGKIITDLQSHLLKSVDQGLVENDNVIDSTATALLGWTQSELDDMKALLSHLAAQTGLTEPGDPLEAALLDRVAEAPDMAYSASLFLALREFMPLVARIAVAVETLAAIVPPGEGIKLPLTVPEQVDETELASEYDDIPQVDWIEAES